MKRQIGLTAVLAAAVLGVGLAGHVGVTHAQGAGFLADGSAGSCGQAGQPGQPGQSSIFGPGGNGGNGGDGGSCLVGGDSSSIASILSYYGIVQPAANGQNGVTNAFGVGGNGADGADGAPGW